MKRAGIVMMVAAPAANCLVIAVRSSVGHPRRPGVDNVNGVAFIAV
jgi:hypothetical protein